METLFSLLFLLHGSSFTGDQPSDHRSGPSQRVSKILERNSFLRTQKNARNPLPHKVFRRNQFKRKVNFYFAGKRIQKPKHRFHSINQKAENSVEKMHFVAQNFVTLEEQASAKQYKNLITKVLHSIPQKQKKKLKFLEINNRKHVSRGLANSKKIILNTGNITSESEFMSVFLHEFGHVLDLGYLKGSPNPSLLSLGVSEFKDGKTPIYENDLSLRFYRISWKNSKRKKENFQREDFVSGYSMSDPFEDFAEHLVFYRLHGEKFRNLALKSEKLQKKYDFLRQYIFEGAEFQTEKTMKVVEFNIWDTTLLAHDL